MSYWKILQHRLIIYHKKTFVEDVLRFQCLLILFLQSLFEIRLLNICNFGWSLNYLVGTTRWFYANYWCNHATELTIDPQISLMTLSALFEPNFISKNYLERKLCGRQIPRLKSDLIFIAAWYPWERKLICAQNIHPH